MNARTKGILRIVIPLAIGYIILLVVLIYNAYPKAYWQSLELEKNRAKWERQNISHYRMSITLPLSSDNYDRMPLTVEVKDGKVISIMDVHGIKVTPDDHMLDYHYPDQLTVSGLFSYAYQTFWKNLPTIRVTYDPTFGYPETIYVDPFKEPCCQDFIIEIRNFEVLP